MKPKIIFWFLFVCVISPPLCAQQNQKLDSLLNAYSNKESDSLHCETLDELFREFRFSNPQKAREYVSEYVALSEKMGDAEFKSRAYYLTNAAFYDQGNIDSSSFYLKRSIEEFENYDNPKQKLEINNAYGIVQQYKGNLDKALNIFTENIKFNTEIVKDSMLLGSSYETKGLIYKEKGDYAKALNEVLKAIAVFEKIDDQFAIAYNLHLLGDIESRMGNFEKSIEHHTKALAYFESNNVDSWSSTVLMCLGNEEMNLKNFNNSIEYYGKSLSVSEKIGDLFLQQVTHNNLGRSYLLLEQYEQALSHAQRSGNLLKITKNEAKILENQNLIGNIYHLSGQSKKALPLYDKIIPKADSLGLNLLLSDSYLYRSDAYTGIKDYSKALEDYKKYSAVKDTIFNKEKSVQIENMRAKYDTEKKEQQIVIQEKEITVLEQQKKISTQQKLLLGGGLLLSLLGYYGLRQKLKRNKIEKEKVDAELEFKKKELTTHALNLARKNETLESLKLKAQELKEKEESGAGYNQLIRSINFDLQDDNNWRNFSRYFEEVHKDFNSNVKSKYPEVTSNELRLLALLKMNLSSKEIANILSISAEGIKKARYRLRKKLDLTTEDSLQDLVLSL